MKNLRILHLRSSGGFYGAEGVVLNLAKELENLATKNYIVCLENPKDPHLELIKEARKEGLSTASILSRGKIDLKTIFLVRRLLKKYNIDILHCHDYKTNFYGFLATLFLKVATVTTNHLWTHETLSLKFYEFLDGFIINFFDRAVAVSDQIALELKKSYLLKKKIVVIHNGINYSKFYSKDDGNSIRKEFNINSSTKIIGSVGRLSTQKGYEYFLDAARKVLDILPNIIFFIVGDGPQLNSLKEKSENLQINKKVIFTGVRNDMIDIYSALDIFVSSSIREGLPLVILEALSMQKPVIATNVGGVKKIIKHQETGILLTPKNGELLAEAIIDLLKNPIKAKSLAQNGRKLIEEHFSSSIMAKQYLTVYNEILN